MWRDLWNDFETRAISLANGQDPKDIVDHTIHWQLDGDQTFIGGRLQLGQLHLPELYSGTVTAHADPRWHRAWMMLVQLNPNIDVTEDFPSDGHRSHFGDDALIRVFDDRFASAPALPLPCWHRRSDDIAVRDARGLAVYRNNGQLILPSPKAWVNIETVLSKALAPYGISEPLGSLAMIADAVPWKFANWNKLHREDREALICAGEPYLKWTIHTHTPPLVIAMGSDARRAMARLCALDIEAEDRFASGSFAGPTLVDTGVHSFTLVGTYHPSADREGQWSTAAQQLLAFLRDWLVKHGPPFPPSVIRRPLRSQ